MTSLIKECIVLEKVIDKYREQNRENPCLVCEHASEKCLDYLRNGIVPYTGEKIKNEENITNSLENINIAPAVVQNIPTLKSTPSKKKRGKKR